MAQESKDLRSRHAIDLASPDFQKVRRDFKVERDAINKDARTVELSFASELPVERWFGMEVLSMEPGACDLSRLNNGGAVLVNHCVEDQVGVVEKAWIDSATRKARALVKFSQSEDGQEIFTDIVDGIRSLVSVGYVVRKMVLQSVDGEVETHRVTDWMPFEVSIVSVPADPSVGVGRSLTPEGKPQAQPAPTVKPIISRTIMADTPSTPAVSVVADLAAERSRVSDINKSADVIAGNHPSKRAEIIAASRQFIENGGTVDAFARSVLETVLKTEAQTAPATRQEPAIIGMSQRDLKRYSILKAIRAKAEGRPLDGLERECSDEVAKKLERQPLGFFLPDDVTADVYAKRRSERTLYAGNAVDGGYTVPSELMASEFVDYLRNNSRVVELGARMIGGLQGEVAIPRQLTGTTAYWVSETGSITASSATFGQIVSRPRRLGTSVPYSKQFLAQSSLSAESFVINDSDKSLAVELDRVAIAGAGGAEPLGILNMASGDRSTSVTFSTSPTWAKYLEFFTNVANNNAILGTPAYLTTPASAVKAMTIAKFTNTATPIWADDKVGAFKAAWSTNFPSSGTLNQVIFGDFSQVLFLEWAGRDVIVDPYGTNATSGTVTVTIQRLIDCIVRRGKSFAISSDSGAQ